MNDIPKSETRNGKVYVQRNLDPKMLRKFRKKQHIILAGKSNEDFFIELKGGFKIFVDAGDYIYQDVDYQLKTMNKKKFEECHEIESVDFVTVKVRREVENKIKDFMEDFKGYEGQVNEQAMKMTKSGDINVVAGHLLLTGIEAVRNQLNVLDARTLTRQQQRKLDRDKKKKGFAG